MSMQISKWTVEIIDRDGKIISRQRNKNTLHLDGEKYMLSAAFATGLDGYGPAPRKLYIGLDARSKLMMADTLSDAIQTEPTAASYRRIPVSTLDEFIPMLRDPVEMVDVFGENQKKVFTLQVSGIFAAESADFGTVRNCFLTTAPEGGKGVLIISSPLKHSFDFWEGYKLTVSPTISLRASLIQ